MRRLHSPWRYNCLLARVFGSCVDGANQRGWSLGGGKAARRGTSALSLLTAAPVIFTLGPVYGDPWGAVHPRFSNERHFPYRASFSGRGDKNLSRLHLLYWPFGIGGFGQLR